MTIAIQPPKRDMGSEREFRFTHEAYHALEGIEPFTHAKIELIRGTLIEMPPIGTKHGSSVMRGGAVLREVFPESQFTVRLGLPFIAVDDSEPEPDFCVVSGNCVTIKHHPESCLLLVEISHTTLAFDRRVKGPLYAESGVADYWIVNLVDRVLEVHREPIRGVDGTWTYATITSHAPDDLVRPLATPNDTIAGRSLLP